VNNPFCMKRKSKQSGILYRAIFMLLVVLTGCGGNGNRKTADTPTSGAIRIAVDESYELLSEAEISTFQALYQNASITPVFATEADVINYFLKDSVPLIIVNRRLTKEEEQRLNSVQSIPRTTKIAYDAVAFIVNRENPDTNLFYDRIADMFMGKISSWKQMDTKSNLDEIKVVFDNYKSGNRRYFREKFGIQKLPSSCFAVENNQEVISYVEKNRGALGVISVNWISDPADTISHGFLKRIKVVNISAPGNNTPDASFYSPHPGYIAQGDYPFIREVYCINRQSYSGLAYGLSSFIAGPQGQLIILHSGLVPATMPVRLVEIKH
jgi:phosphate transport system substrate-binding protein